MPPSLIQVTREFILRLRLLLYPRSANCEFSWTLADIGTPSLGSSADVHGGRTAQPRELTAESFVLIPGREYELTVNAKARDEFGYEMHLETGTGIEYREHRVLAPDELEDRIVVRIRNGL